MSSFTSLTLAMVIVVVVLLGVAYVALTVGSLTPVPAP